MGGQGELQQMISSGRRLWKNATIAGLGVLAMTSAARSAPSSSECRTPSCMSVPRYVSRKFERVNARAGPGDDQKLLWIYRARGLPLQVIAETLEWRRVCDPEGSTAWVHKRVTDGRRMTMNTSAQPAALLKRPDPTTDVVAYLNAKALAAVDRCGAGWCRVRADHATGWVREGALWGTTDALQCH
jgi:SH3-like domain-containing protein